MAPTGLASTESIKLRVTTSVREPNLLKINDHLGEVDVNVDWSWDALFKNTYKVTVDPLKYVVKRVGQNKSACGIFRPIKGLLDTYGKTRNVYRFALVEGVETPTVPTIVNISSENIPSTNKNENPGTRFQDPMLRNMQSSNVKTSIGRGSTSSYSTIPFEPSSTIKNQKKMPRHIPVVLPPMGSKRRAEEYVFGNNFDILDRGVEDDDDDAASQCTQATEDFQDEFLMEQNIPKKELKSNVENKVKKRSNATFLAVRKEFQEWDNPTGEIAEKRLEHYKLKNPHTYNLLSDLFLKKQ